MRRPGPTLLLALGLLATAPQPPVSRGQDPGLPWWADFAAAREASRAARRPLLVALHPRAVTAGGRLGEASRAWERVYEDPEVAREAGAVVCARREPTTGGVQPPLHLILDLEDRVVASLDGPPPEGEEGREAFLSLLRAGRRALGAPVGTTATDAPAPPAAFGAEEGRRAVVLDPSRPGLRVRLAWLLPMPPTERPLRARVRAFWDGAGPFDVGALELRSGEPAEAHVDVPLREMEELAARLTPGRHVLDLDLEPAPDSTPFLPPGAEAVRAARILVLVAGPRDPDPQEAPPPPPAPEPPEEPEGPPPPPSPPEEGEPSAAPEGEERVEVVDPLVREGTRPVPKEGAVVAVRDPEAGLEPPRRVPLEQALRDFDRVLERALGAEEIRASDRAFLERYFRALRGASEAEGGR